MEDVIKHYVELRAKAKANNSCVAKALNISEDDLPCNYFNMLFNNFTLIIELLHAYYKMWINTTSTKANSREDAKLQNGERIIWAQKVSFIEALSSFEYCAKKIVGNSLGEFRGRIYLREIMERSKSNKFISDEDYDLWDGLISLRNSLVHNNGISDKSAEYNYPKTVLKMEHDVMTQGNLYMFGYLLEWMLDASKQWILSLSNHKKS